MVEKCTHSHLKYLKPFKNNFLTAKMNDLSHAKTLPLGYCMNRAIVPESKFCATFRNSDTSVQSYCFELQTAKAEPKLRFLFVSSSTFLNADLELPQNVCTLISGVKTRFWSDGVTGPGLFLKTWWIVWQTTLRSEMVTSLSKMDKKAEFKLWLIVPSIPHLYRCEMEREGARERGDKE